MAGRSTAAARRRRALQQRERGDEAEVLLASMPPSPLWGVLILIGLAAFIAGSGYAVLEWWALSAPPDVRVPNVIGIQMEGAQTILAQSGLDTRIASRRYDEHVPAGKVITTNPGPNRLVKKRRVVDLVVSDGSAWTSTPDVRNMSASRAQAALAEARLSIGRRRQRYSDNVPEGYVIDQDPAAEARVKKGSRVDLVISKGPAPETSSEQVPHFAEVEVAVPEGGPRSEVMIELEDSTGIREVYRKWHEPGDSFIETVQGAGDSTVRVYIGGRKVQEKVF